MVRDRFVHRVAEFFANAGGGVRGRQNIAAWALAGTIAYYFWIVPERKAQEEREARYQEQREKDLFRYAEKVKPTPNIQDSRIIRGSRRSKDADSTEA
eukprot:jgi/Mesen1/7913/ME000420S07046